MLQLQNITKSFGGVKALKGVDLELQPGEIHALLGENGAGKSTLMKVISGAHAADSGTLIFNGETIAHNSPHIARLHGISIIYQEFSLVPELSVAENIFLGRDGGGNWVNWNNINREAADLIHSIGFDIKVTKKVRDLTVAQQQVVEIAKALSQQTKLLILDEPSAVLGPQEVKKLFSLLRKLKAEGVSIIYISHHLEELLSLTDRITVLKDGKTVATMATNTATKNQLVALMVGRELSQMYPDKKEFTMDAGSIKVQQLVSKNSTKPLSFELHKGEILGIGGLVGAGRTEVLESLFGLDGKTNAIIQENGIPVGAATPKKAVKQGWGLVPEDRKKFGGLLDISIRHNISLANQGHIANKWGFINQKKEEHFVNDLVKQLQIKLGTINDPLSSLSGGNQQKVILAKWLHPGLKVLLVDEPTRGVDVGARAGIYQIIQDLANKGIYILMVSSDMEELIGLSDRIMVLKNGSLQGIVERKDFAEETILKLAIGAN